jgi:glutamyl-tRNA synthetase
MRKTRLAPSPTGALHLGNARTFLVNWLIARQNAWKVVLRIEDIDGPRIKQGAAQGLIEDLRWLEIDWDEGPITQSDRRPLYTAALEELVAGGYAYPCVCSRREVEAAASAPHAEDGAAVYPGTCRGRFQTIEAAKESSGRAPAIRFAVPQGRTVAFDDGFAGPQSFEVARQLGDFVIAKADGTPAYQLAVVVDDAAMGVTDIVRGDDLIDSTPRQILLYEALGWADRIPTYCHLPLVVGTDGRRLAKRHGDTRLRYYRDLGVSAERVLALLARWCGVEDVGDRVTSKELLGRFNLQNLSKSAITFTADDDAWLRLGVIATTPLHRAGTA